MDYKNIGSFLEKFKNLLSSDKKEKESIVEAVFKATGALIKEADIKISGRTLYIQGSSQLKSEIFMKKEKILKELSSVTKNRISEIR